jgi:putative hemolysin
MKEEMKESAVSPLVYPVGTEWLPTQVLEDGHYETRFATSAEDLDQVLQLRFEVFNLELNEGLDESFESGRDEDEFDAVCHHLMVLDKLSGELVGTYRMQTSEMAGAHRGFYSEGEFRLDQLPPGVLSSALEVGRACVSESHRNTQTLFQLWRGLALYVAHNRKRYLFGCSSLTSQDPVEGRAVTELLERKGHFHPELRVEPQPDCICYPDALEPDPSFPAKLPTLFRIYLRHGAKVCGPPAIDRLFKTIDYLVIFDVDAMDPQMFSTYFG